MSDIPENVMEAAQTALMGAITAARSRTSQEAIDIIARAILTERQSQADAIAAKDREIAETRQRTFEECAKVADAEMAKHNTGSGFDSQPAYSTAFAIAAAIRSLGKEGSGE